MVAARRCFDGRLPLAAMARLRDLLADTEGEARFTLEFGHDALQVPFAALRVISDPATRALPALAVNAVKPDGNIDLAKVLRGVARNPLVVRALVSTGRDFNRALRSLRGCQPALILQRSPAFAQVHHNRNHAAARRPTEVGVPTPVISALGRQMAAAGS